VPYLGRYSPTKLCDGAQTAIFTGSIARSATCRYLIYSKADFDVFRPAGATRCTDGGEIGHGILLLAEFHSHRYTTTRVYRTQKLIFLLRFDQNVEYKRPTGAYPLRDLHKICRVCTPFHIALGVKIWLDMLKGLCSYGGFKLRPGVWFPPNFQLPLAAKLCARPHTF